MQDPKNPSALCEFLSRHQAAIVMLSGAARGTEYPVAQHCTTLGRGPCVDLSFDDPAMLREHARIEFVGSGFTLRCAEGAVLTLNGGCQQISEIKNGDRFELGEHAFEFVVTDR